MSKRLAIVMGRNYTSRLGMIRAAGMADCEVAVIQTDRDGKNKKTVDSCSKYVSGYYIAPQPDSDGLVDLLLNEFTDRTMKPVLLPTDDYTASVVDMNMDRLREHFLFPHANGEQGKVVCYMDKALQKELAKEAGLSVAEGWTAHWKDGGYVIPDEVEFPCFIKPEISFKGANKQRMQKCETREQLEEALAGIDGREDYPILIEQFIAIEKEYDIPGLALKDEVIVPGIIEKGEIYLGVTASGTMMAMNGYPEIQDKIKRFVLQFDFMGLIDVELFESDGVIYFNELNLRFGASGFAMTGSGVNLPGMFIQAITNGLADTVSELSGEKTFASEKVLLSKRGKMELSKKEYEAFMDNADFTFIYDKSDPKPYQEFMRLKRMTELKLMIKRLLRMQ